MYIEISFMLFIFLVSWLMARGPFMNVNRGDTYQYYFRKKNAGQKRNAN
ncbi:MAG: hypothetical protein KGZ63_12275 [Clostridiales bacterium]|nr:hypothetical protein [Clostridiales bacterium]